MVTINGVSRNMGHDMLIDNEETYRELVRTTSEYREYFASYLKHSPAEKYKRRLIWLRLLGLIETWDMKWTGKKNTGAVQ